MTALATKPTSAARRYELSDAFFKSVIHEAVHDSLFSPVTLHERHDIKLKPKFKTACWAYLPPHRIYIGTDLFEKQSVKEAMSEAQQRKYIANHYHHELGHALYTERDMKRIQRGLKTIECPFSLYNLFEDAWMEERYRREADYRFEWLLLEDLDFSPRPESLLFALIQAEGDVSVVENGLRDWKPNAAGLGSAMLITLGLHDSLDPEATRKNLQDLLPRVVEYYRKILAVSESMHQMPILKAWLDEFGRPPQPDEGNGHGGSGFGMADLELSAELMTNEDALEEFEADVDEVQGSDNADGKGNVKGKATPKPDDSLVSKKGTVLHRDSTPVDMGRAETLAARLKKFFAEKTRVVGTRTPQRRISARHFVLDRAPYRRTEVEGRGKKTVFFVFDCSGSMGGFHTMEGKVIVTALSILARQGHVEGHIALSGVVNGPCWELYKLPLQQEVISRIKGYAGAEGLEYTMRDNLKLLREADYSFVYTDAQICDKPIDKTFFHRHGVYTWGLYAGQRQDFLENMLTYFDKAILRENAEDLVDVMLVQQK